MKLRVLGASGAEFPGQNAPGFLVDDALLLDAGTIGAVLVEEEQWNIKNIILTHAHLDHIKSIPFLADNIILKNLDHNVTVHSIKPVLGALKDNLLNNVIWPDFTQLPDANNAVLRLEPISIEKPFNINGYTVTAFEVSHSVPAVGYVVQSKAGRRLLYSGDTGPTKDIWKAMDKPIHAAIIEVSMPNSMEEMAVMTGHLTASLLATEIKKMKNIPERIYITHPKPQYMDIIVSELQALGMSEIELLRGGEILEI